MEPAFWKQRWQEGQIGFHSDEVHPGLVDHADVLLEGGPHRILVPLCGKSVDLAWLAEQGHDVVGIELVRSAVEALFEQAGLTPEWSLVPGGHKATAGRITVFQGDFFELDADAVGSVDRIWDRAAFVALHPSQRTDYAERLKHWLRPDGVVLLNVLVYDGAVSDGPPWTIPAPIVQAFWPGATELSRHDVLDDRWRSRGHKWFESVTWRCTAP